MRDVEIVVLAPWPSTHREGRVGLALGARHLDPRVDVDYAVMLSDPASRLRLVQRRPDNLMEIRAVFEALRSTPADRAVVIETDSRYVIGCFTQGCPDGNGTGGRVLTKRP